MYSESYQARRILVQPPLEVQPVTMSVFMDTEQPYLMRKANRQVLKFMDLLTEQGIEVVTIREALLQAPLEDLRELAAAAVTCEDEARSVLVRNTLPTMEREDLIDVIVQGPQLRLIQDPEVAKISPDSYYEEYTIRPLFGLMFPRDHFIITNRGVILGNFRRKDRRRETAVVRLALHGLGAAPLHEFAGECFLEGGDFATTSNISFIANGLRTNEATIRAMMEQDLFGTEYVVEMFDGLRIPAQFHLDHYFNILDEEQVILHEARLAPGACTCNVYRRVDGQYEPYLLQMPFAEAAERLGVQVIALPEEEADGFALNFLNLGNKRLACTAHISAPFVERLQAEGYAVEFIPFDEVNKQYGSLHCATQTLTREQTPALVK